MSLKEEILNFLKSKGYWVHGGDIENLAFSLGFMASNAGRRCRELFKSGLIMKEIRNGSVWYRYKGEESKFVKDLREIRERALAERELNHTAKLF